MQVKGASEGTADTAGRPNVPWCVCVCVSTLGVCRVRDTEDTLYFQHGLVVVEKTAWFRLRAREHHTRLLYPVVSRTLYP